jgi:hypothetical protein
MKAAAVSAFAKNANLAFKANFAFKANARSGCSPSMSIPVVVMELTEIVDEDDEKNQPATEERPVPQGIEPGFAIGAPAS